METICLNCKHFRAVYNKVMDYNYNWCKRFNKHLHNNEVITSCTGFKEGIDPEWSNRFDRAILGIYHKK